MTENTNPQDLIALLRTFIGDTQIVRAAREAADVIEKLVSELETAKQYARNQLTQQEIDLDAAKARIAELEAMLVKANDAWLTLSQTRSAAEPLHKFALIRDRNYEGEGLSLWTWNGENYSGADGDCLSPDPDGTLDGYTVEWLTDHQLEQRLNADAKDAEKLSLRALYEDACIQANKNAKDAERYRWLRDHANPQWRNGPGLYWYLPRFMEGTPRERLDASIDAALAASEPKNTGN